MNVSAKASLHVAKMATLAQDTLVRSHTLLGRRERRVPHGDVENMTIHDQNRSLFERPGRSPRS